MVRILENPVMMSRDEMASRFDGKWIYVVNCEYTPGDRLIRGIPVVEADMQFEGVDSGIYNKYDADEYGSTLSESFLDTFGLIRSISLG